MPVEQDGDNGAGESPFVDKKIPDARENLAYKQHLCISPGHSRGDLKDFCISRWLFLQVEATILRSENGPARLVKPVVSGLKPRIYTFLLPEHPRPQIANDPYLN